MSQGQRRLAAIMFTDMAGYTALGQKNEPLSLALVDQQRSLVRPILDKHGGREVKTMGDAFLVEFASAFEAVVCAVEIQSLLRVANGERSSEKKIYLRIGIHLGDVIHRGTDVAGDAVNIASRIEALAPRGGICVTQQVQSSVVNKVEFQFESLGTPELKNVTMPMEVFRIIGFGDTVSGHFMPRAALPQERLAVLPFVNMSPDPNDEYFADGMTEELISTISNIKGLSVISRTSAMKFKGESKTAKEIGLELQAGTILEGSVRKADNIVRVTAQLIDVNNDKHLWAEKYDRELKSVFSLQSDIAKQVADSLSIRVISREVARIDRKPTENVQSYTLYLKGRYLWNKRGIENVKEAIGLFEKAVREDPGFALGYVGLADSFLILRVNWGIDVDVNYERAKNALDKALLLDPGLAEAHATMGLILSEEYHFRDAEVSYRKAIELKPSYALGHMWYRNMLTDQLRWDEGLQQLEKAMELDPLSPSVHLNHSLHYYFRREYSKALELCKRVFELDPDFILAYPSLAWINGKLKRFDDMKRNFEIWVNRMQSSFPMVGRIAEAYAAFLTDNKQEVERLLPELKAHLEQTYASAFDVAGFNFYLGKIDEGFEWLEQSYSSKESDLVGIRGHPLFDGIPCSDPRYLDLLRRMELDYPDDRSVQNDHKIPPSKDS